MKKNANIAQILLEFIILFNSTEETESTLRCSEVVDSRIIKANTEVANLLKSGQPTLHSHIVQSSLILL